MTRINTNVGSLVGRNNLQRSNASLAQSLTRLSTGLRINTGKDDPAGLIASENLRSDITAIKKAISNTDRANQVIATADSALGQVSSLLNDIRGLVTESANAGALSDEQISANQLQVDSSLEALNRIAQTTTFQGRRLLDGSLDFLVTQGTNSDKISNLQIDQANLGATGEVSVDVNVTTAATQATVEIGDLPDVTPPVTGAVNFEIETTAAEGSTGSVDFDIITADTQQGTATLGVTSQAEGTFTIGGEVVTIAALAGGNFDAAAGNAAITSIVIDVDDLSATGGNDVDVDLNSGVLTLTFDADAITVADVVNVLSGTGSTGNVATIDYSGSTDTIASTDFTASTAGGGATAIAADTTIAAPTSALAGGGTENFTLVAVEDGPADGAEISAATAPTIAFTGTTADDSASYDAGTNVLTINIDSDITTDRTFQDIADLIADAGEFTVNGASSSPVLTNGSAIIGGTAAAIDTNTGALTVTVDGVDEVTTTETIDITGTLVAGEGGDIGISFAEAALGGGAASTAVIGNATSGYTVQINTDFAGGVDIDDIRAAIASINEVDTAVFNGTPGTSTFNAIAVGGSTTFPDAAPAAISLTGGVDQVISSEAINITTEVGFVGNLSIGFAEANLSGTPTNTITNGANDYTIQIDSSAPVTLEEIRSAIADLAEVGSATLENSGSGSTTYNAAIDVAPTPPTLLTGAGAGNGVNGIDADLVFELAGSIGSEVLTFEANTSLELLVTGINAVSDATGVTASANNAGDGLILESAGYGSNSFVDLQIIQEDESDVTATRAFSTALGQGTREAGTDIVASVNGITANGDGNELSINTATLDLSATIDVGFTGTASFNIDGGGALFQLGPDVVSNQQARLGISSVNTAALGGVNGLLYQLQDGGSAALANDPNVAAAIVEEAIDQVTSLRGRLGAFQRTTLETNKNALNDTLANLTEAESSIRDADFAEETANLTRSQILVQSGTRVLGIANQNPQNVLGLLG
ncbi:A-type flagellin [Posidoniimonas polymericola]|uniref:Flagellin n=1 Tax=Posidoniimonas polymericola TaxID=2528002 RepID=A0A5C5YDV9_9BACT|nr:flagellin [Posidoniimonas polymericola]TWT73540.1 A-type flagellin [Posidoniimonas polymericola]